MVDTNESSARAAVAAAPHTNRVPVPGAIVAPPAGAPDGAQAAAPQMETLDAAAEADLGALISRERRRHAETLAGAGGPLAGARGARVCCVLCFDQHHAGPPVEDAG